ncbi:hypothetical protein [Thermogemmatispora tikiterensis]|uniref:Uncharacterized protein n=1 Tax=Thermogemmatispora tikiterensis TaxID=1825093 RepID=A0A328VU56_9CHLR|nr:hypothetical protein [Thermogemmatispora tikiterensis]RAQ97635.1 hypothetical protein A4R35_19005 [Thermogemmatispora tikiterensis]
MATLEPRGPAWLASYPLPAAWGLLAESTRQNGVCLARFCFAEALTFRQATHSLQSEQGTERTKVGSTPVGMTGYARHACQV